MQNGTGLKIFSGKSNEPLAKEICEYLDVPLGDALVTAFPDNESFVRFNENIRGTDVFLVQSTSSPANHNVMELLIMIDAAKRASAARVTAVLPFFGYARQDRKDQPRVPITSKLVANLLVAAGVNRVLTMDLHAQQIQGFFDIPVDNLFAAPTFVGHIKKYIKSKNIVCVAPDVGGVERARAIGKRLSADLAIIDKRRSGPGKSEVMNVIGNVKNKTCIIIDDLVDSGGTIVNAATALKNKGAKDVYAYVVHGVLTGEAVKKINKSKIKKFVISNSILNDKKIGRSAKFQIINVGTLLAEAIKRISISKSVSKLFK